MYPKTVYILIILFLLSYTCLKAQDSTLINKSLRWNLSQCIEYAKKNNIQVNSLRLSQKTAQQEYLLAKAARGSPTLAVQYRKTLFIKTGRAMFQL